jgi:hypothetical protein
MPMFYQNDLAMRNTAYVTDGKPIAVCLQSMSGGDVVNSLLVFYEIYGRKRDVLFFCFLPDTTQDDFDTVILIDRLIQQEG